jgi:RNA polymerase sigma-70 factor (ECF subfamily)
LRFVKRLGEVSSERTESLPEETLLVGELRAQLSQALHSLTPQKRVVIVMAEVEGLSGPEIAQALDIPLGTVWTRLHHARAELRKQLSRRRS